MKMKVLLVALALAAAAHADGIKPEGKEFYVYKDAGSKENHFCPSGWMGSAKSLRFNPNDSINPKEGKSDLRIEYDVNKDPDVQWAGIYWLQPCNNWASAKGGYDLTGFKKLTFWAKGSGLIDKFGFGGISPAAEAGDSDEANLSGIELTPEWKQYTIDLKGLDLSHVIGGFVFAANVDSNYKLKSVVLNLDEIKFEK